MAKRDRQTVTGIKLMADPPVIEYGADEALPLEQYFVGLLVRLALTPNRPVPKTHLEALVSSPDTMIVKGISELRGLGMSFRLHSHKYQLLLDPKLIDVHRFDAAMADHATQDATLSDLDELLAMWECDPRAAHPRVPGRLWDPLFRRRDELVTALAALPRTELRRLRHLDPFLETFPSDRAVARLRRLAHRKLLLIVDDTDGDDLKSTLGDYECDLVTSWPEMQKRVRGGRFPHDAALVDLHLETELNDGLGLEVLKVLRPYGLPAILMSAGVPPGGDLDRSKLRHGFDKYYSKLGQPGELNECVADLLRDGTQG